MSLLPNRHPQRDFFVLDIADAVPKDDTASMEHPFFSLATKPDMRHLIYGAGDYKLEITPSGIGLPTIFDKDILIFCVSQLMHRKNRGETIGQHVRFTGHELLTATNRPTNNLGYDRLDRAFKRLRGTTFTTNIRTGNRIETRTFGMIDEGGFVRTADHRFRLDYCEVVLSDWLMRAIEADEVLTLSPEYFRIRRPLERRLYEIARKHCGNQSEWQIGIEKLQAKTGSNAEKKRFRHNLRQIIDADVTPSYRFQLDDMDKVTVRPRPKSSGAIQTINVPEWAEEKAREIALISGYDYYSLLSEWQTFAQSEAANGRLVKNAGKAFVAYCQKRTSLR